MNWIAALGWALAMVVAAVLVSDWLRERALGSPRRAERWPEDDPWQELYPEG